MASIAQVVVRFGVDLKDFSTKMQKATREIQAMGRQMQQSGRSLTQGLTVPILALGGASVKLAADFDESMTKIQTLVGVSADVVDGFKDSVLELAGRTSKAPAELADALFTVTSAGLRGAEAMQVLEMAAKGSAIGMGETKEIAKAVTAVMQAYGPETMSAAKAMDILTATVREGNLEASELAPVLGRVVGIAAQLGVGFEEVGASIATFTRLGVDSSEAVTGLSGFLNSLIKPSKEGADALAEMGMSFADLRREVDEQGLAETMIKLLNTFDGNVEALGAVIPNVRALGAVMGTAGVQGKAYLEIQNNISNSTDILNKAFEDTAKSGAFRLKEAFNTLKQIGTDIGSILLPVVAELAGNLRDLFRRFSQLNDGTKETIVKIAAFAAAIGPALYVVGTMITSIGTLTKTLRVLSVFLSTNPWFALAGAIGAVVAGVLAYTKINKQFEGSSSKVSESIAKEKGELNALVGVITDANISNEARSKLLDQLQQKYPDFLGNLNKETATNDDLKKALERVNAEYEKKIINQVAEEKKTDILRRRIELQEKEAELIAEKNRIEEQGISGAGSAAYVSANQMLESAMIGVNKRIKDNQLAQQELNKEYQAAIKFYDSLLPQKEEDAEQTTKQVVSNNALTESFAKQTEQVSSLREELDFAFQKVVEYEEKRKALLSKALAEADETLQLYPMPEEDDGLEAQAEKLLSFKDLATDVFGSISGAVTNMFKDMLSGAKVSIKGIIDVLVGLIAKLAAAALAAAVLNALIPGGAAKLSGASSAASGFASLFKNFAGFRATGGPVSVGSGYIVGENGPEYFQPNTGGSIIPNHMLGGFAGGGGKMQLQVVGNVPITFQPNGSLTAVLAQEKIRLQKLGG